jgi:tight adherence protein B
METILLPSCGVTIGILFAFLGLALAVSKRTFTLKERLENYGDLPLAAANLGKSDVSNRLASTGFAHTLASELARAGLPVKASEFILLQMISTLLGFVLGLIIFHNNLIFALVAAALGFFAPRWYVSYLQHKRLELFDSQLEGALSLLSNAVRSGYGFVQAIEAVSNELAQPSATEFGRVVREFSLGISIQSALANMLRRNPSMDLDLIVTALNVQHEVGGNLAEILDTIGQTIRERVRIDGEIRALTSQQRFSARVLILLPIALGGVLYAMNPSYISLLWEHNCGLGMLGFSAMLMVLGYLLIRRIIAVRY